MFDHPPRLLTFRSWLLLGLILLIGTSFLAICAPSAMSQAPASKAANTPPIKYKPLPPDVSQKKNQILVNKCLTGGTVPPEHINTFNEYYKKYIFARWTHPENYDGPSPKEKRRADLRKDLRNDFARSAGKPSHTTLMTVVMAYLPKMANAPSFHPIVRYNAMLAIGDLNQREPKPNSPTIPLPQALPILMKELSNPKQIAPVKIAALIGLQRHATFKIADAAKKEELSKQLIAIVQSPESILPKASVAGQMWVRTLAIETLGILSQPSSQPEYLGILAETIAEKNGPLPPRCSAAMSLGKTNFTGLKNVDPAQLTSALSQLTSDICAEEIRFFEKTKQREREEIDPREYSSRRLGVSKETQETEYLSRPRATAALNAVSKGLNGADDQHQGVRALPHPTGKPIADALAEVIEKLIRALDNDKLEDEQLVVLLEATRKQATKHCDQLTQKTPPPAPAPTAKAPDG